MKETARKDEQGKMSVASTCETIPVFGLSHCCPSSSPVVSSITPKQLQCTRWRYLLDLKVTCIRTLFLLMASRGWHLCLVLLRVKRDDRSERACLRAELHCVNAEWVYSGATFRSIPCHSLLSRSLKKSKTAEMLITWLQDLISHVHPLYTVYVLKLGCECLKACL